MEVVMPWAHVNRCAEVDAGFFKRKYNEVQGPERCKRVKRTWQEICLINDDVFTLLTVMFKCKY